jgi:hypothetical protein
MIALGLCIFVSTLMFSCFRLFPRMNVRLEDAIVINYMVAATLSVAMAGPGHALERLAAPSSLAGAGMGLIFLYMFRKIGECTQQLGLGVVAIATKMSMVLPMLVFIALDPSDAFTWHKGAAIGLAFPAVWLASTQSKKSREAQSEGAGVVKELASWTLPAIVFVGSGLIDLGFGWFSSPAHMSCDADRLSFASIPFTMAAFIGVSRWVAIPRCAPRLDRATVLGGIILGVINVGSLFFLLSAYEQMPLSRSAIVPMINLGVVLATSLAGMAFFSERPSRRNLMGWLLASTALVLLLQSD